MPVTRNRLTNQKSSSGATNDDALELRSQSRGSNNESEKNDSSSSTEAPAPRTLRDRASLAAKSAGYIQIIPKHEQKERQQQSEQEAPQQQSEQQGTSKVATTSGQDSPHSASSKRVPQKGLPPTRVLSRRSSFRPQSLLNRETPDEEKGTPETSKDESIASISTTSNNQQPSNVAKKLKRDHTTGDQVIGLDLTKRPVGPGNTKGQTASSTNTRSDKPTATGFNSSSLLISYSKEKSNPAPAVRISLPGVNRPVPSCSNVPTTKTTTTVQNGSQVQSGKKFGIFPLGLKIATEMRARMASGSLGLSKSNTSSTINRQPQQLSRQSSNNSDFRSNQILLSNDKRQMFNVLVCVTGSVATIKLIELIRRLYTRFPQTYTNRATNASCLASITVRVIMTEHSKHFVSKNAISNCVLGRRIEVFDDADEWSQWKKMGDPVLHIELKKWADLCLIAPLDANTMAKLSNGICDNLLTCVVRAWDTSKRLIYCPAMNSHMYEHPLTREQLCKLQSFGYIRIDCIEKTLACGDFGRGAMASVETIVEKVVENLLRPVPRLTSPNKPLLNQQPTYQILSTSDRPAPNAVVASTSSGTNLLDRFRASDKQLNPLTMNSSMRSFESSATNGTNLTSTPHNSSFSRQISNQQRQQQKQVIGGQSATFATYVATLNRNNGNSRRFESVVESVKNLTAVNPGLSSSNHKVTNGAVNYHGARNNLGTFDDDCDDDEDEFIDEDDYDEEDDDDGLGEYADDDGRLNLASPEVDNYNCEMDPSNLLEQSLMISEDPSSIPESRSSRAGNTMNSSRNLSIVASTMNSRPTSQLRSLGSDRSASADQQSTPFFNVSTFLSTCYVKERNCFNCAICKNDYKNRKSMSRHLREQHVQGNIYQCEPCGIGFKRREKLMKHNRDRHGVAIEPPRPPFI